MYMKKKVCPSLPESLHLGEPKCYIIRELLAYQSQLHGNLSQIPLLQPCLHMNAYTLQRIQPGTHLLVQSGVRLLVVLVTLRDPCVEVTAVRNSGDGDRNDFANDKAVMMRKSVGVSLSEARGQGDVRLRTHGLEGPEREG
jgi:hypothetical protein